MTFVNLFTAGAPVPDSFIEGYSATPVRSRPNETTEAASHWSQGKGVADVVATFKTFCDKELVNSVNGVFEFHLTGKEPGVWYLDLKNNTGKRLDLVRRI